MICPICGETCEYVDWKIRIPSPKRVKQWDEFWETYKAEKRLLADFHANPNAEEVKLELLNLQLTKKRR